MKEIEENINTLEEFITSVNPKTVFIAVEVKPEETESINLESVNNSYTITNRVVGINPDIKVKVGYVTNNGNEEGPDLMFINHNNWAKSYSSDVVMMYNLDQAVMIIKAPGVTTGTVICFL